MKTCCFTLLLICLARPASAQVNSLNIYPNATIPQCPNVEVTYTIIPWNPACHRLDTVIGGTVVKQVVQSIQLKVTIVWQLPADSIPARLAVVRTDSACGYAAPGQGLGPDHYQTADGRPFFLKRREYTQ